MLVLNYLRDLLIDLFIWFSYPKCTNFYSLRGVIELLICIEEVNTIVNALSAVISRYPSVFPNEFLQ